MKETVLVTGASGGIGGACARAFAREGCRTVIHYFSNVSAAASLEKELSSSGLEVFCARADLRDEKETERMLLEIKERFGDPTVLINNAGVALPQCLFTDTDADDYRRVFDSNVLSCVNVTRLCVPAMVRQKRGRIVNVSSVWGVSGGSCEALYSASKAALIGLTKALAKELGPSGITVNCLAPGVIDTKMNAHLSPETMKELGDMAALCRIGSPEDVAKAALFLASDEASFITGQVLGVDGGF